MGRRNGGAALLLVVLLVALLAILVVEFQREARVELRAASNLRDDIQAHALVRSGAEVSANILAIYQGQSLGNLKKAVAAIPGGELLWDLFFGDKDIPIPVPDALVEDNAVLTAHLENLYGRFPLGALYDPQGAGKPRQQAFKEYLAAVKQYLGSREVKTLESADTDALAQAVVDRLTDPPDPKVPIDHLSELREVDGFTPEVLKALSPYLDTRAEWEFDVNKLTVPLLMVMKHLSVEDAQELAMDLRENPVEEDGAVVNDARFGGRDPQLFKPEHLKTKSRAFQVFLEAEVRGVKRRAKAVFRKRSDSQGTLTNRFRLEEWLEGWVEDWPEPVVSAADGAEAGSGGQTQ